MSRSPGDTIEENTRERSMKNGAIESDWIMMKADGKFGVTTPLHFTKSSCHVFVLCFSTLFLAHPTS
jgi:hypothetical protein